MGSKKLLTTLLASGLAEAVRQDERPEVGGFDLSAGMFGPAVSEWLRSTAAVIHEAQTGAKPIDMVLHCPQCHKQHIDAPGVDVDANGPCYDHHWDNPPHRSHLCHGCGHQWRPADVPTNGVEAVKTKGKHDSPIVQPRIAERVGIEVKPERVRHVVSGRLYDLIGDATVQSDSPVSDMTQMRLYRGDDGRYWVRPVREFSARFVAAEPGPSNETGEVTT